MTSRWAVARKTGVTGVTGVTVQQGCNRVTFRRMCKYLMKECNYMNSFILAAHDRSPVTRYTGYTSIGRDPLLVKTSSWFSY
jgi:hypothetical protein